MTKKVHISRLKSEDGIALLIAIFVLLLISVVAIALLVASGTETALGTNYRYSSTAYYAALAGLEEARGRLLPKNPNYLNNMNPALVPTPFPLNQITYVINRSTGDNIAPADPSNKYYDNEYYTEFGVQASAVSNYQSVYSVWDNDVQGIPGPFFKWVRINAVTEQAIYLDVNGNNSWDTPALFYDPAHVDTHGNPWPSLIVNPSPPSTAVQALELTALAYLPNGSHKILQYLVAPVTASITFPAALTLDGYSDAYGGPSHGFFQIQGNNDSSDHACSPSGPVPYPVSAIGVPDNADVTNVRSGIPAGQEPNYSGLGGAPNPPSVSTFIGSNYPNLQSVQSLNTLAQTIVQNADAVIVGGPGVTQTSLPSAMSSTNPMTIAIQGDPTVPSQGDFSLTGGFTGYGLLLVTGNFTYTPDSNWYGIILVIGQGSVSTIPGGAAGSFKGAVLIAQTRSASGNPLPGPNPGPATFNDTATSTVGSGYFYNCGWIQAAEAPLTYKVLSFHEIPQ